MYNMYILNILIDKKIHISIYQFQIIQPESLNHLNDFETKENDPVSRVNYNWVRHIINQMNATYVIRLVFISTNYVKMFMK